MGGNKSQHTKDKTSEGASVKESISAGDAVYAKVEELIGRTGARGEVTQVKCLVLDGRNRGKSMRRNANGPVKIGDLLLLRETEIEARKIRGSTRRSV